MKKSLTNKQLVDIAKVIKERIYVPLYEKKTTIFLCGADINNSKTGRYKIAKLLQEYPRYELLYPETLFGDLLAGQGKYSLLELEDMLADSVDAILIVPESPGSFAELGAFSNNTTLASKIIAISENKYKNKKSFINYGPYRLIKKSSSGKVFNINYDDLKDKKERGKFYNKLRDSIAKIKKEVPISKNVTNILEAENFILPCIYLLENIGKQELYHLLKSATFKQERLCKIATQSALACLIEKRYVTRTPIGYKVTKQGAIHVRDRFDGVYLDRSRLEIMNVETRKNSTIRYDRITSHILSE